MIVPKFFVARLNLILVPERHYLGIKKELVKALDLVNWYEGENHIVLYIIDIK